MRCTVIEIVQIPRFETGCAAVGSREVGGSNDAVVVRMVNTELYDGGIRKWNEGECSEDGFGRRGVKVPGQCIFAKRSRAKSTEVCRLKAAPE